MLPDDMNSGFDRLRSQIISSQRARVAAFRQLGPTPGSVVLHVYWGGLVVAVTDNAVWMLKPHTGRLFKVA